MKPRHAAVLALVGWYLMVLPKSGHTFFPVPVPWNAIQKSFDTAKECEEARAREPAVPLTDPALAASIARLAGQPQPSPKAVPDPTSAFYCISSDDVRLHAKF
ncbi:MAG: hypothetical protein ABSF85_12420 [Terriglobales bacterium]